MKYLLCLLLALIALRASAADYTNPILVGGGADPAVLFHDGLYYCYTTNQQGRVYISEDLVNWREGPKVLPEHLKGAWAPEVYYHPEDGKFYLYYTYKYKIGVAVADRPDAPFEDLGFIIISAIDGHLFRDDDGALYLYFTYTPDFTMYCVPMFSPTEAGGPSTKCFEISQDWERNDFSINEGPWIFKQDGTYYLFYSGSDGQSKYYSVGYASAATPLGPWKKNPDNPVVQHTEEIWGPGHGSFARDRAGQWWHVYHQKTSTDRGWKRFICIDPLVVDGDNIYSMPTKGETLPGPASDPNMVWAPEISPRGAYFYDEVTVTLTSATPDAAIYYTLDGSEPTPQSERYEGPFQLVANAIVTARAFKDGMAESGLARHEFFRTNFVIPQVAVTGYPSGEAPFRVYPSPNLVAPPPRPAPKKE